MGRSLEKYRKSLFLQIRQKIVMEMSAMGSGE